MQYRLDELYTGILSYKEFSAYSAYIFYHLTQKSYLQNFNVLPL